MAQAGAPCPRAERMIEMAQAVTQTTQLHEDKFFKIVWDEGTRIIGIDWKEATSAMTDEQFKAELTLFAGHVEQKKARGILVDVNRFRHKPGPDEQPWRIKNISNRYSAAGVVRFAFLFPEGAQIPPMMNQSSPGEKFVTRAFNGAVEALAWLKAAADSDPASIVRKFLDALGTKDFETLRGLIDEGVSFRGPLDAHEDAASFIAAMRNSGPMIERVNVIKVFVDGSDVCAIFEFVTNQPSIGATPCAEWYRVEEGKIKSMKLFFDARPYEALFKSGATAG